MNARLKQSAKKVLPKKVWNFLRHYRAIIRDRLENGGSSVCRIPYCGYELYYGPGDLLIKKIRNGKIFEEKMCRAIVAELEKSPQPIFLDVGANIGLISLYAVAQVRNIHVYAFEPGPHQNAFFTKTLAENNLSQITLSDNALGNKDEVVTFIAHFSPDSSGDGLIDTNRAGEPIPTQVQMTTIDSWWERAGRPGVDVMKIDIEGAELWAFEGAVNFLKQAQPTIFMEIEPKNLKVYPYTRDDILKFFVSHGYALYTLDEQLCTKENWQTFIGTYDTYIARPVG